MSMKIHLLAWLDTETTALSPADGDLLEIGCVITDMRGVEQGTYTTVVKPNGLTIGEDNIEAIRLHLDNGLLRQALTVGDDHKPARIARELDTFLGQWPCATTILHPAGTNIGFDLAWLTTKLPDCERLQDLSHRCLDLTGFRLLSLARGEDPYGSAHATSHRVADCLERDLNEYRHVLAKGTL